MSEVILVDFSNLTYACQFAQMNLQTSDGQPTGTIYGFLQSILSLHKKHPEASFIFCMDSKKKTWRHEFYPEYKGNRIQASDVREIVNSQIPVIKHVLRCFGFKIVSIRGMEADDLIGVLACGLKSRHEVIIFSNDKDFYQLLGDGIKIVRKVQGKQKTVKPDDILFEFGVGPEDWVKFRALMGDASDNIKPLAGVGPKTAVKMLKAGVDPSIKKFKKIKAADKYPQIVTKWSDIHKAYVLSYVPRDPEYKHFSSIQKEILRTYVSVLAKKPHREMNITAEAAVDSLLDVFWQYEMQSLINRRNEFLTIR